MSTGVVADKKNVKPGFQFEIEIKPSLYPVLGLGIFTKEFIPCGTLIWKYCRGVNVMSYRTPEDVKRRLSELNTDEQAFFMSHVYLYDGYMNEIMDDGKYWNHSESPNTGYGSGPDVDWQSSYAVRDIQPGEELFDDYGTYEYPEWFVGLAKEYDVPQDFFVIKQGGKPGFHVEYEIKPSTLGGLGIFAKTFIPKDALIWKFAAGKNVRGFDDERAVRAHLAALRSHEERYDWISHVYCFDNAVNEILDDGRYWNHSTTPNTHSGVNGDWDSTYAKRDISAGEELLDDYSAYEYPDWFLQLYNEYNVPYDFIGIDKGR